MKTSSCKAKGRILQQWVRDSILAQFPALEADDVRSTGMGQQGGDVQLSPTARKVFAYEIECKSLARIAVYAFYKQAQTHGKHEPLVVIKANREKPLVLVDADHFFALVRKAGV